ncbi:MAG TPA: hypothetical protein VFW94_19415 [Candidatus Acidoferrales bacterium]|nr:hypothetical protein [Candidatus Acidoferrales bacterium]
MTSSNQLIANRLNAKKSTGPTSERGKCRSRRNAVRHGLTAETVVDVIENEADYFAFEAGIKADYQPQTSIEHDLLSRLASLLWRLRRATAIESGLLQIQAEIIRERKLAPRVFSSSADACISSSVDLAPIHAPDMSAGHRFDYSTAFGHGPNLAEERVSSRSTLAQAFLRLANFDSGSFDRLNRYEMGLWRQAMQTVFLIHSIRTRDTKD